MTSNGNVLETNGNLAALSADVKYLGKMLGDIIKEQHGAEALELVETVRGLTKTRRNSDWLIDEQIVKLIDDLDFDSRKILIKAFSNYFQLINIAEDQQRIRVLREREAHKELKESMHHAIQHLKERGLTAQDVQNLLKKVSIRLVLTAHPSEAKRTEVLVKLQQITRLVAMRDRQNLLPRESRALQATLLEKIEEMWQTSPTRHTRATVNDEVDFGLHFITSTIMQVTFDIYEGLRSSLREFYPTWDWSNLPPFLRFASWIGGDRDGNPYVTPEVTLNTFTRMKQIAEQTYSAEVLKLRESLTQSLGEIGISEELLAAVQTDDDRFPPSEVYRRFMNDIYMRLKNGSYSTNDELLADLHLVQRSLRANHGAKVAAGNLQKLVSWVELFGFHLTPLDIREDARFFAECVAELLAYYEIEQDYLALSETEKQAVLTNEIGNMRPFFPAHIDQFSEVTQRVIKIWKMIAKVHRLYGKAAIDSVIASHTEQPSDVLTMLLLAKEVGVQNDIDIVPLFETVDSLQEAGQVMQVLFANKHYAAQLMARNNHQQIMIGYSDSCKDGGYVASNWSLYTSQAELADVCQAEGISLELFHGRGGSIGRGGGPTNRAILSQPPRSMHGRIKITEQGEVIAHRYSNPDIALRHLQQVIHAVLLVVGAPSEKALKEEWVHAMEHLSETGRHAWRDFVYETEDFGTFWMQATPINELSELPLGSRPAKRKKGGFENVRAIPWVFSWMQSRAIIPSWFGVGAALAEYCTAHPEGLSVLQEMYSEWSFFKALIQNTQLDLAKADMGIVEMYAGLVHDEKLRTSILQRIKEEHALASKLICEITGQAYLMEQSPILLLSIERRNPYTDPLNFIQVALLRELRGVSEEEDPDHHEQLLAAVLSTVNGIAAAMKTTG